MPLKSFARRMMLKLKRTETKVVGVPVLRNELLARRKALITGGTGGIGLALAKAFVAAGAKVVITGRSRERLDVAIANLGGSTSGEVLDNLHPEGFPAFASRMIGAGVDILVNNAGVVTEECSIESYDRVMDTNLRGAYFLSKAMASAWQKKGVRANVLNVCSTSSLRPGVSPYVLAKWGLRSLTLGLAKELIPSDIVVNGIAPGPTLAAGGDIDLPRNPSGRRVTAEEVANLAVILVSDLSRMVVGDVLYVGGGAGVITFDDL